MMDESSDESFQSLDPDEDLHKQFGFAKLTPAQIAERK